METDTLARRTLLRHGGAGLTGLTLLHASWLARAFPSGPGEEVVPWLDLPPANPSGGVVENLPTWESLDSWLTPNDKFFSVAHYNKPVVDEGKWKLEIGGMVAKPMALSLAGLKSRPRKEIVFTLDFSALRRHPASLSKGASGVPAPFRRPDAAHEPGEAVVA